MKNFKFLSAALGLLALTACNSDDVFNSKSDLDFSGRTMLVVTDGDSQSMRAYKDGNISGNVNYAKDDSVRVYDSHLQVFDKFEYAESESGNAYFGLVGDGNIKDKNAEGNIDYAYALFGSDNVISYAGWNNGLLALLKVVDKYEYKELSAESGTAIYKSILPTFGVVTPFNSEIKKGESVFKTTQYTLAGRVKVVFENGAESGARRVRVTSLKFKDGQDEAAFKALELKKQNATPDYSNVAETEGASPLAGWFEAVLTDEPNAARTDFGLREIQDETGAVQKAKGTSITVTVPEEEMKSYTNVIYFPIVPNNYDILLFEYSTEDSGDEDWNYIGYYSGEVLRSTKIGKGETTDIDLTVATQLTYDNITIPGVDYVDGKTEVHGLQSVIEYAVGLGKAVDININAGTPESNIAVGDHTNLPNYKAIKLPKLDNDITLNIYSNIVGDGNTLTIEDADGVTTAGEGVLTINYIGNGAAVTPAIVVNTKANIAFASETDEQAKGYAGAITVNGVNDLTLNGKFAGEVALNSFADLTLGGAFTKAINAENANGNVVLKEGTYSDELNIDAATITVEGKTTLNKSAKKWNATTAITIDDELEVKIAVITLVAPTIDINKKITTYTGSGLVLGDENSGTNAKATLAKGVQCNGATWTTYMNLDIEGIRQLITEKGKILTIKKGTTTVKEDGTLGCRELAEDKNVYVENGAELVVEGACTANIVTNGGKVTIMNDEFAKNINVNENATIDVQAGNVGTITVTASKKANITTSGAATINTITGDEDDYEITATWDAVTTAAAKTATSDTANEGTVYTALQLAALNKLANGEVSLYANVNITDTEATWTPLSKLYTFEGNNHSIKGLVYGKNASSGNNSGFFGYVSTTDFNVSDLTLEVTSANAAQYVGGLVSNLIITGTATIENVTVKATALSGNSAVGGLIGQCSGGAVTITDSKATVTTMTGQAYVGGLIGTIIKDANVTVEISSNKAVNPVVAVTTFALPEGYTPTAANAGTFGMLVGGFFDGTGTFEAKNVSFDNTIDGEHNTTLGFDRQTDTFSGTKKSFTGSTNNAIGFSPKAEEGSVKINGVTYLISSLNSDAKAESTVNWFGKLVN